MQLGLFYTFISSQLVSSYEYWLKEILFYGSYNLHYLSKNWMVKVLSYFTPPIYVSLGKTYDETFYIFVWLHCIIYMPR